MVWVCFYLAFYVIFTSSSSKGKTEDVISERPVCLEGSYDCLFTEDKTKKRETNEKYEELIPFEENPQVTDFMNALPKGVFITANKNLKLTQLDEKAKSTKDEKKAETDFYRTLPGGVFVDEDSHIKPYDAFHEEFRRFRNHPLGLLHEEFVATPHPEFSTEQLKPHPLLPTPIFLEYSEEDQDYYNGSEEHVKEDHTPNSKTDLLMRFKKKLEADWRRNLARKSNFQKFTENLKTTHNKKLSEYELHMKELHRKVQLARKGHMNHHKLFPFDESEESESSVQSESQFDTGQQNASDLPQVPVEATTIIVIPDGDQNTSNDLIKMPDSEISEAVGQSEDDPSDGQQSHSVETDSSEVTPPPRNLPFEEGAALFRAPPKSRDAMGSPENLMGSTEIDPAADSDEIHHSSSEEFGGTSLANPSMRTSSMNRLLLDLPNAVVPARGGYRDFWLGRRISPMLRPYLTDVPFHNQPFHLPPPAPILFPRRFRKYQRKISPQRRRIFPLRNINLRTFPDEDYFDRHAFLHRPTI